MGTGRKVITRRDFLRVGTCFTVGSVMGLPHAEGFPADREKRSRVVLVRDKRVLDEKGRIDRIAMQNMLDRAVTALMDATDPYLAWKQLAKPEDVVGVKTNI
ncbi:MAG: hypothetical protein HKM29_03205, partial [Deltaproteobacteria bacterium]|nr:hypothetical protein [Deltaproteobacteria bacterium]